MQYRKAIARFAKTAKGRFIVTLQNVAKLRDGSRNRSSKAGERGSEDLSGKTWYASVIKL